MMGCPSRGVRKYPCPHGFVAKAGGVAAPTGTRGWGGLTPALGAPGIAQWLGCFPGLRCFPPTPNAQQSQLGFLF